jgi:hypothetical protein
MTRRRDLGPTLAIAGAAIALASIIAGFVLVGGPGDTRDRRIDHWRLAGVARTAAIANCAYALTKAAPESVAVALETITRRTHDPHDYQCTGFEGGVTLPTPTVEYRKLDASHIELCQTFLRPDPKPPRIHDPAYADVIYPDGPFGWRDLDVPRSSAGRFCYRVELSIRTEPRPLPGDNERPREEIAQ